MGGVSYNVWLHGLCAGVYTYIYGYILSVFSVPVCAGPNPVAARSKAFVCHRSLAGNMVSNPTWIRGCLCLVYVSCCQVEVYSTGRSLVQGSPTECCVSECDQEQQLPLHLQ
jgi:hypothetical protein